MRDVTQAYPRAAAVASRLVAVASTGSTNRDLVRAAAEEPDGWPHLSVLLTTDQRAGRGRLDRQWIAPAGTALAVSVVLRMSLPPQARGWIPLLAGAAMTRAVARQAQSGGHTVGLKWPNDVLVDGRKICGILAEAVPGSDAVVVGSGVNTRMPSDALPVPTATSFADLGIGVDEDLLLADYLAALAEQLRALVAAGGDASAAGLRAELEALCLTLGRDVEVSLPDGSTLAGRAQRLDADGRLVVVAGSTEVPVAAGDVIHVR
ncbi:biotin--[acetyl-CoA-carboxylase] ligase [Microbacterium sp. X-17]|uniref:biotin--[acetyl-CoA-carboxylase] ligase n=1 Tax=Microbacterium sp. X-17 TaxID=3144404 RepID=UPI0031F4B699